MTDEQLNRLAKLRHLALDLDGTLYLGGRVFEFTAPFLATLEKLGVGRTFFTNNSSKSTKQYVEHLRKMGIAATEQDIYSSTHATLHYLRTQRPDVRRLFVLGTPGLQEEIAEHGYELTGDGEDAPDAVVIGFDTTLTYARLCRAAWWISKGKPYIATHPDRLCPTDQPTLLVDCGAMCAMLTHATGRQVDAVLGKPAAAMLQGVMHRHGVAPHEIAVVGDRLYTDMAMARNAGGTGILVLTGETTRVDVESANPKPDFVVSDVGALGTLLEQARGGGAGPR
jgi:HAD superfamily hydrolase (TIGR01450 family)